jgi:tetratricopeptide (TPR) repeat protein
MKACLNLIISLSLLTGGSCLLPFSSIVPPVQAQVQPSSELEALGLIHRGRQQNEDGQTQEAMNSWRQALQIYQELGNCRYQYLTLTLLGVGHIQLKEYQLSLESFETSLKMAREFGDRQMEGFNLLGISAAHAGLSQYSQAIEFSSQGLEIAREIGNQDLENWSLHVLAFSHYSLGEIQQASEYSQQAQSLSGNTKKSRSHKDFF